MNTVYIAGPMTGYPEFNYPAFRLAGEHLRASGYIVLNPIETFEGLAPATEADVKPWDWYMRQSLALLLRADAVATLPDWEQSRGARLEIEVARTLNMNVMPVCDWLVYGL